MSRISPEWVNLFKAIPKNLVGGTGKSHKGGHYTSYGSVFHPTEDGDFHKRLNDFIKTQEVNRDKNDEFISESHFGNKGKTGVAKQIAPLLHSNRGRLISISKQIKNIKEKIPSIIKNDFDYPKAFPDQPSIFHQKLKESVNHLVKENPKWAFFEGVRNGLSVEKSADWVMENGGEISFHEIMEFIPRATDIMEGKE